jgi:hypothetical protein
MRYLLVVINKEDERHMGLSECLEIVGPYDSYDKAMEAGRNTFGPSDYDDIENDNYVWFARRIDY